MTTVCVTGAAGFVGSALVSDLRAAGFPTIGLDVADRVNRLEAREAPIAVDLAQVDLAARSAIDHLRPADVIVHLAALAHVDYSMFRPHEVLDTNIATTVRVLEAARLSGARVVIASSVEVYSGDYGRPFDETDRTAPQSPYGASKVAGEALARSYGDSFGVDVTVLRFTNLYGPWQAPDRVIPRVLRQRDLGYRSTATRGRVRDFLHIDDAVCAIRHAVSGDLTGRVLNVSTGSGVSIEDLVKALRDDDALAVEIVPTDKGRELDLVASPARLMDATGWTPKHRLMDDIGELQRWSSEHSEWLRRFDPVIRAETGTLASLVDCQFPLAAPRG